MTTVNTGAVIDLAVYRAQSQQLRQELAEVNAKRARLLQTLHDTETVIAAALSHEQPLLPIDGLQRSSRSTRHGRAVGRKLNAMDRRVLRIIGKNAIAFSELQKRSGINEWTLRDSITRLMVHGRVKRFGLARATRFAKASLKTEPDKSLLGFLVNK
jgi:hypothetical protein